jgi:hypothetical protein
MMGAEYDTSEKDRLWTHRLHEDLLLSDRGNFFLVAESLFVVAYAELLPSGEDLAAAVLAAAGVLLTAAWLRVNRRQYQIIGHVQGRAENILREFRDTYDTRPPSLQRFGSTATLVTWVPTLLGATWIFLLVIAVV